ncbi:MAG: PEGA domain-containing protein [Calditrichaeota bacterium]|nr:PEGA domain-containing protein [Calditrichota bacterium]
MSYSTLQRIKAEEFERFFESYENDYQVYLNHLGEIQWMREAEAEDQHEFYLYTENALQRFHKRLNTNGEGLEKLPAPEREARLQIRAYLEEKYLGGLRPTTEELLPRTPDFRLSEQEIEHIPVTLDVIGVSKSKPVLLIAAAVLLVLLAAASVFFLTRSEAPSAALMIQANVRGAWVFVDEAKRGYADFNRMINNITPGEHRISVRKPGFLVSPPYIDINVAGDTLLELNFNLQPISNDKQGFLSISSNFEDAKVFVNDEFQGMVAEVPLITLPEGEHSIVLEREGYVTAPRIRTVQVNAGDTAAVNFTLTPAVAAASSSTTGNRAIGSLEISASVNGARILLNGQDTGKEADHIFTNLPLGKYTIQVVRNGFQSFPSEHSVDLTTGEPRGQFTFELKKEAQTVILKTVPATGKILIDGKLVGSGVFEGDLKLGSHKVSFSDVPGYRTPREQTISVAENRPIDLTFNYVPIINLIARVTDKGISAANNCEVLTGYTFNNRGFSASDEAGPEIVFDKELNEYFWKFGFAFAYRDPRGNDAIKVTFNLPQNLQRGERFSLRIAGVSSGERYPLSLSKNSDIKIKFNGKVLSYYYNPNNRDESRELKNSEWDISNLVRPGSNTFELFTTEDNNVFYFLKEVEIRN